MCAFGIKNVYIYTFKLASNRMRVKGIKKMRNAENLDVFYVKLLLVKN